MEFAKEHCLNTSKSEVAKKQKVRSTKRKFRVDNVRRARNKNEVATEREKQFLANNKKRAKFAKKLRASYNKRVAAKKQELLDRKFALLMFRNEKGQVQGYNTIYKKNGDFVGISYVFDCDTLRIVKESNLIEELELRKPLCENALLEKEELEADVDSDVAA